MTHLESMGLAGRDGCSKNQSANNPSQNLYTHISALEDPVAFSILINLEDTCVKDSVYTTYVYLIPGSNSASQPKFGLQHSGDEDMLRFM